MPVALVRKSRIERRQERRGESHGSVLKNARGCSSLPLQPTLHWLYTAFPRISQYTTAIATLRRRRAADRVNDDVDRSLFARMMLLSCEHPRIQAKAQRSCQNDRRLCSELP